MNAARCRAAEEPAYKVLQTPRRRLCFIEEDSDAARHRPIRNVFPDGPGSKGKTAPVAISRHLGKPQARLIYAFRETAVENIAKLYFYSTIGRIIGGRVGGPRHGLFAEGRARRLASMIRRDQNTSEGRSRCIPQ
jgi:hypothetical protein